MVKAKAASAPVLRSGRVSKKPTRYGTEDEVTPKPARTKPVASAKKETKTKTKAKTPAKKTTTKKTAVQKAKKTVKKAADVKPKKADTKKSTVTEEKKKKVAEKEVKKDKAEKTKKKKEKDLSRVEAPLPDLSSSLEKAVREALNSMNTADLKRVLKNNDCVCTGTKEDLRRRVAFMMVKGVPDRCPLCFGGRLKLAQDGGFFCPGSFDDDKFIRCTYVTDDPKTKPWKKEENALI